MDPISSRGMQLRRTSRPARINAFSSSLIVQPAGQSVRSFWIYRLPHISPSHVAWQSLNKSNHDNFSYEGMQEGCYAVVFVCRRDTVRRPSWVKPSNHGVWGHFAHRARLTRFMDTPNLPLLGSPPIKPQRLKIDNSDTYPYVL